MVVDYIASISKKPGKMSMTENLDSKPHLRKNYMNPVIEQHIVKMTIPDKPNNRNQRYIKTIDI